MSTRHLDALFNPQSIVILGASEDPKNLGGMVLRNLLASDYPGKMLIVNPSDYKTVHGIESVTKVSRMPYVPDLAIVCIPPEKVPRAITKLGQAGIKTAMILTGGLSRTHSRSGRPLMYSVRDAAKKSGIRILGPNTIGIAIPGKKINASYAHMNALPGRIAFIGQSGTLASGIIDWAFSRGVGFSHFLTLGDGIDIGLDDLIDYFAQDRTTKTILLHLEKIRNPKRFISAVRAASRGKLVIAVKSGRVPESEWEPVALPDGIEHSDIIYDAVLRRAGVLRVNGTDEMFDALETLTRMKPLHSEKLVVLCNGLGPNILAVDRFINLGGQLVKLSDETIQKLSKLMPPYWTKKNPIDLNYDACPWLYQQVLQVLTEDPEIDNVLVMYAPSLTEDSLQVADAVMEIAQSSRLNLLTCWLGHHTVLDAREAFFANGVPTYFSPEKAVKAFMYHVVHRRSQRLLTQTPTSSVERKPDRQKALALVQNALNSERTHLNYDESRELIGYYGIPALKSWSCADIEDVIKVFRRQGGPVNVTLLHQVASHPFVEQKSGRGRYRLSVSRLNEESAIRKSCLQLFDEYKTHFPDSGFLGYSVSVATRQVGGLGFSLGITRDPVFGPLIVCGASGSAVSIVQDRHVALPPLNMVLAHDLLRQSYMYQRLKQNSHQVEQDIQLLCETLIALSQITIDLPHIKGLEILPMLFTEEGAIAMDVSIDLAEPASLSIQPYPEELTEQITLPNSGRNVVLRAVKAEDEPADIRFYSQQSPESIRYRFFQYRKSFSHKEVAQMVQIDYDREMVFIASAPIQKPIQNQADDPQDSPEEYETLGSVRVWIDADNVQCEFAVIVHDSMKGEGLGRKLMTKMIDYCKRKGTIEMIGSVLPENEPMLGLAKKLGFSSVYDKREEVMTVRLLLNEPKEEWQKERLQRQGG